MSTEYSIAETVTIERSVKGWASFGRDIVRYWNQSILIVPWVINDGVNPDELMFSDLKFQDDQTKFGIANSEDVDGS